MIRIWWIAVELTTTALDLSAQAAVTEYTNKAAWNAAVNNSYSTIFFTGYPDGMFITNQYVGLGVLFTDGNDSIHVTPSFITDGAGMEGNNIIHLSFTTPMNWIAVDFPGLATIKLYNQGNLVFTSMDFDDGGTLAGFGGLVSTTTFDGAVILKPTGTDIEIDNLHFGPPVPAPGALGVLCLAGLIPRRRRL